jgi:hypothetical protein
VAPVSRIEPLDDLEVRKGTDVFSVAPPEPTDTSLEAVMASTVPPDIATPKDQASSE